MDADSHENLFSQGGTEKRNSPHFSNKKYHDDGSSPSIWHWLMWTIDFVTGPYSGVLMALAAIILLHHKSNIINLFSSITENGIQETMIDFLLSLCDLARAYYQIVCEVIRNFCSHCGAASRPAPSIAFVNPTAANRVSSMNTPPPLVVIAPKEKSTSIGPRHVNGKPAEEMHHSPSAFVATSSTAHFTPARHEIEPAFLDNRDYPKGWLVYHPRLGVISKEEADRFDRDAETSIAP